MKILNSIRVLLFCEICRKFRKFRCLQNGYAIRNSERYAQEGINVNFVEKTAENKIFVENL